MRAVNADHVDLSVDECFVHCAKALIRSDFWAGREPEPPEDPHDFVNASRFVALASMDADGRVDISPKGDPAGLLVKLDGGRAVFAERPGNKLAFGYRNILDQPRVAALALVPGHNRFASFTGTAALTADDGLRASFTVDGKTPILTTVVDDAEPILRDSPTLAAASAWSRPSADLNASTVLHAHLKLNKTKGVAATALRLAATRGVIESGLQSNYKTDLY